MDLVEAKSLSLSSLLALVGFCLLMIGLSYTWGRHMDIQNAFLSEPARQTLRGYASEAEQAWRSGDAKALATLFAEDGFVLQSNQPPVRGRSAIEAAYAGQGGSPQWAFIHPRPRVGKGRPVARQHLDIGQHVVAPRDGLGGLQMGEAGHDPIGPGLGLRQKGLHQGGQAGNRGIALVAHPQPEIDGDLIIARPRRVQSACGFADDLFQPGFHIHVDVFQIGPEGETARFNL